jgi:hypothetical protein
VPGNGRGRPSGKGGPDQQNTATYGPVIVPDPYGIRSQAQARLRVQDRHRRVCRELEQLASLVEHYCGPRRSAA